MHFRFKSDRMDQLVVIVPFYYYYGKIIKHKYSEFTDNKAITDSTITTDALFHDSHPLSFENADHITCQSGPDKKETDQVFYPESFTVNKYTEKQLKGRTQILNKTHGR